MNTVEAVETTPLVILMPSAVVDMTDDQFAEFCQINRDLRIERNANGDAVIMPPAFPESSHQNLDLASQLQNWSKRDGTGVAFDSSGGFKLPNSAIRAADGAWVLKSRLKSFSKEEKKRKFLPLCPDFVAEIKSATDRISDLKEKLREYMENGARLGWLINPDARQVFVYRSNQSVECLDNPQALAGDPVLPGFVLDLKEIWDPEL